MNTFLSRTRRNHGLEHATLNLLARTHPGKILAGHSDGGGFWIVGDISTEELRVVVSEALGKLKDGEEELAIHKNCGTNLLVSGFAAGLAGTAGLIGVGKRPKDKLERIPIITLFSVLALIISKPLGPILQKNFTTDGNPGSMTITSLTKRTLNGTAAHRIKTQA